MAWDDTKSDEEGFPASEYNAMVTDQKGHGTRHNPGATDELDYIGVYSASKIYSQNDLVYYGGSIYKSLQGSNTNNTPGSSPTYWINLIYLDSLTVIGVEWDYSSSSPALTQIDLLGNTISLSALDWARHPIYSQIRRCNLADNGAVNAWHGDTGFAYDGTNGQVMVNFPAFYTKEEHHVGDSKYRWFISPTQLPGFQLHPAFIYDSEELARFYTGSFEACTYDVSGSAYRTDDSAGVDVTATTGDLLASIAGAIPTSGNNNSITLPNFRTLAQNRGTGWELWNYNQVSAIQLLYLIRYANFNSQTIVGEGVTDLASGAGNQSLPTGYTAGVGTGSSDLGNATGEVTNITHPTTAEVTQQISLFGIEAFYGNIWSWMDGINIKADRNPWISDHDFESDKFAAPYVDTGLTLASANDYVKAIALNPNKRFGFLATDVSGGSSSTYLTDYYYQNTGNLAARLGGNWLNGATAGAFCWSLNLASSDVARSIGARLAFIPHSGAL